jgi:hypothetical protein
MFDIGQAVQTPAGSGVVAKVLGSWVKVEGPAKQWWQVEKVAGAVTWAPLHSTKSGGGKAGPVAAGGDCTRNHGPLNQLQTPKGVVYCRICYREDRAAREATKAGKPAPKPKVQVDLTQHNPKLDWTAWEAYWSKWSTKLEANQRASIKNYTGSAFGPLNEALRAGKFKSVQYSLLGPLDTMVATGSVPWNTVIYRGGSRKLLGAQPGEHITDNGYMSCSTDRTFAMKWKPAGAMLEIRLRRGQCGAYIAANSQHPGEREFLLPRGSELLITERREESGRIVLTADLL